jgi:PQQ-dependent catabolism-associated CXXCW motif protein
MPTKTIVLLASLLWAPTTFAFSEEENDWGVAPIAEIRQAPYSAPTPLQLPGAKTIRTAELHDLLVMSPSPILIDVAGGDGHLTLKGAHWLPGLGRGTHFLDSLQADLLTHLERLTGGDKFRPVVFYCVNARCWLSYNSSLRAVALGYKNVFWFRGGIEAWREAGLPMANAEVPSTFLQDPGRSQ